MPRHHAATCSRGYVGRHCNFADLTSPNHTFHVESVFLYTWRGPLLYYLQNDLYIRLTHLLVNQCSHREALHLMQAMVVVDAVYRGFCSTAVLCSCYSRVGDRLEAFWRCLSVSPRIHFMPTLPSTPPTTVEWPGRGVFCPAGISTSFRCDQYGEDLQAPLSKRKTCSRFETS